MKRKHEDEMVRFAQSPEGTKVWFRAIESRKWVSSYSPSWSNGYIYIVDDEWSKIAKQCIDDPSKVECHIGAEGWVTTTFYTLRRLRQQNVKKYRIKPKEEEEIILEDCKTCKFIGDRGVYCNKLGIMRGGLTYCSHYVESQS